MITKRRIQYHQRRHIVCVFLDFFFLCFFWFLGDSKSCRCLGRAADAEGAGRRCGAVRGWRAARAGGASAHAAAGHGLEELLDLRRAADERVRPEGVARVLDELDEGDQQTPATTTRFLSATPSSQAEETRRGCVARTMGAAGSQSAAPEAPA